MNRQGYSLYLSTYHEARSALVQGDDPRLHDLCAGAAARSGLESALSLLAMSDAETGHPPRGRAQLYAVVFRSASMPG